MPSHQVSFVVEDDEDTWGLGDTERRAFFSACITLTLGVLGRCASLQQ
jgi:hypothetical protein